MGSPLLDFHQLLRALEEHPEWRAELRRLVLSDELLSLPEIVRDLADAQRRTEQRLEELIQRVDQLTQQVDQLTQQVDQLTQRLDQLTQRVNQLTQQVDQLTQRLDQLTQRVDQLTQRVDQLTQRLDQLTQRVDQLTQRVDQLAEAQRRTEEALAQLTRRVEGLTDQVGELRGEAVERRYRERAHAYFGRILRRLRVLPPQELADLLDDAMDAGRLSLEERDALLWADVIAEGRSPTGERVALVVEASATVSQRDVTRAVARAASFAKVTGLPTWAVVAGESIAPGVQELAQREGVWQVLDGRVLPPEEA